MENSIYVALSSQLALERRLTTIADNVANAGTVGFRATEVKFNELLDKQRSKAMSFVSKGDEYISTQNGGITQTGNQLDFAIRGNAWFSVQTPAGDVLTKDGRFTISAEGSLLTTEGYSVLDAGGAPIILNPGISDLTVSGDGVLQSNGAPVAALGLYEANLDQGFVRAGSSGIIPNAGSTAIEERGNVGVLQGYVEESNVNPITEMTALIMLQRNFDNVSALMSKNESSLESAIKTLGSRS